MAMTARLVYEGVLTEMNKVQAPSMLLEDFNYFINKAVNQYINKKYNIYDVNQLSTDDLRVLKATLVLPVLKTDKYGANTSGDVIGSTSLYGATYEAYLPYDYLHMLNCICNYKVHKQFKCYDPNTYVQFGATRLTADLWGLIINNFYMKPSYKKPYYYLHNVNINEEVPTNPYNFTNSNISGQQASQHPGEGTDMNTTPYHVIKSEYSKIDSSGTPNSNETYYTKGWTLCNPTTWDVHKVYYTLNTTSGDYEVVNQNTTPIPDSNVQYYEETYTAVQTPLSAFQSNVDYYVKNNDIYITNQSGTFNLPRTFNFSDGSKASLVEKATAQRIANASKVRIEIRTGKDDSIFELKSIYIDYIKAPQFIRLTQEQIDLTEDTSQMMEFPDYVCQEIINELTHLIMENSSDPRLQSHMPVTMSIANPAQGLTQESSK